MNAVAWMVCAVGSATLPAQDRLVGPEIKFNELWALLASYAVLMLGCMVPGL